MSVHCCPLIKFVILVILLIAIYLLKQIFIVVVSPFSILALDENPTEQCTNAYTENWVKIYGACLAGPMVEACMNNAIAEAGALDTAEGRRLVSTATQNLNEFKAQADQNPGIDCAVQVAASTANGYSASLGARMPNPTAASDALYGIGLTDGEIAGSVLGAILAIAALSAFVAYYTSKNSDKARILPQGLRDLQAMDEADPDFVASRRKPSAEEALLIGLPQLKDEPDPIGDPDPDVSEDTPQGPGPAEQTGYLLASSKKTGQVPSLGDESES